MLGGILVEASSFQELAANTQRFLIEKTHRQPRN
jgi:hypothetical protein